MQLKSMKLFSRLCYISTRLILVLLAFLTLTGGFNAEAEEVDFNTQIRPLLSNNCLTCHGPDEDERAAGLRLDTEAGSRLDLGGYAAIAPGNPKASEILQRLTTDDEELRMPPEGKGRRLTPEEVDFVRRWIAEGGSYEKHWAYNKPTRPSLPTVSKTQWPRNSVDHFILAELETRGLKPSPEADRWTLARRVSLDLIGLPPSWEEARAFVEDEQPDAYEQYVGRLLDKPAFGERWARVWLDLARYADSAGYADDPPRTIWAFRDYVIKSLNENKPFDQFTIEQIAGDLLENPTQDQLAATAFHRNTLTNNEGGTNDEEFRNVAVIDRVNTTMAVWMGTTIACAQCHTHKYDPITQEEYFKFFAFFNNTQDADRRNESPIVSIWSEEQKVEKQRLVEQVNALQRIIETGTPELQKAEIEWLDGLETEATWITLDPSDLSANKRELSVQDGWVVGGEKKPDTDQYRLAFPIRKGDLVGIRLEVPGEQSDNFVVTNVAAMLRKKGKAAIDARYVRVDLAGAGKMIHLAEIQAFVDGKNIATSGTVTASSEDFGGKNEYVNDGKTDGQFNNRSVSHTKIEKDPWIEIDLGELNSIDRIALWNRTDNAPAIQQRLRGYRVSLLNENRDVVWEQTPKDVPTPNSEFNTGGPSKLPLAVAFADHEQDGFPATAVLQQDKNGWAIAPKVGRPHTLTLLPRQPVALEDVDLILTIEQESKFPKHLLDRFRVAMTSDQGLAKVAEVPPEILHLVRSWQAKQKLSDADAAKLSTYYRSITPLLKSQQEELKKAKASLDAIKPATTVPVMAQVADSARRESRIQIRGNYQNTGVVVEEGTPAAFHALPEGAKRDRLALAKWLVDDENPLTARVIANRHWEEIFGVGIVQTSEEFGSQGDLPSHPQLLDWLAVELQQNGWDLKQLLTVLVTSATYRQSSYSSEELRLADPANRFYARGPRFRVSAEMVRDQALFVSGLLSDRMYGPPVKPPQPSLGLKAAFGSATDWQASTGENRYRRGLYTSWRRSSPYPSMAQFDAPNREVCTVRRIRTNTPLQALVTLNDPVYVEAAQALARSMIAQSKDPAQRIQYAFRHCLLREPSESEVKRVTELSRIVSKEFEGQLKQAEQMATVPIGPLPEGGNAIEFAAWTVVGNVILNLDEMFMKR
jgi:mono/diheme cytochrome c family protein